MLVTGHAIPAEGLPSVPRIVVAEQPIELTGFEMTPEERARFEEQRSARIDSRAEVSLGGGGGDPRGILICVLLLPVCIVVIAGTMAVVSGVKHAKASAREPSLIPEQ